MPASRSKRASVLLALGIAAWVAATLSGFVALARYEFTPGRATESAVLWPVGSTIERANDRPTLLIFAHPRCPCSQATVAELEKIVARCQDKLLVRVVLFCPEGAGLEWTDSTLCQSVRRIPGARITFDSEGHEAKRFGVSTSGHALLYDVAGRLLFSGGITGGRGHEGDNAGRDAVIEWVDGHAALDSTPVYGCPIVD
ncbi:MAG: hypothetical protein ACJ8C4_06510 [Gemmataceae bacterium]